MAGTTTRRDVLRTLVRAGLLGAAVGGGALTAGCTRSLGPPAPLPAIGSGPYTGAPLTLRFWNGLTGGDGPVMRRLLAAFTEAHPQVRVEMYALPWPDFYQKFPASVVSGLAPDLALMHNFQVVTNAARGVLVALDEVLAGLGLREADYLPVVWGSGVFRDRRWSIPLDMWPDSLFYNRRVLAGAGLDPDAPPQDAAGYRAALETLRAAGVQGHWLPVVDTQAVGRAFDSLFWQHGGTHYAADGTGARFADDAGVAALAWQQSLVRDGFSPTAATGSDANVAFKNDRNAFLWGGPGALINDLGGVAGLDWGVAPLPTIGPTPAAFAGSHQFVVARQRDPDPDRLRAVVTFLAWMQDNVLGWAAAGPVPARLPALTDPRLRELPAQADVATGVDDIRFYPLIPGIAEVQTTVLYPAISDALLTGQDPRTALDTAAQRAGFLLAENTTKYGAV